MECEYKVNGIELRIVLPRELDHHVASQIREETDLLVSTYHIRRIIFDFKATNFMDSSGIGVILGRYRNAAFSGGKIVGENANQRITKLLTMAGLSLILQSGNEKQTAFTEK